MSTKYKSIKEFIQEAPEWKKQQFFEKVIQDSLAQQREILAKAEDMRHAAGSR